MNDPFVLRDGCTLGAHKTMTKRLSVGKVRTPESIRVCERHSDREGARGKWGGTQTHSDLAHFYRTGTPMPNEHAFSRELRGRLALLNLSDVVSEYRVHSKKCRVATPIDMVATVRSDGAVRTGIFEIKTSYAGRWTEKIGEFHPSVRPHLAAARIVPTPCGYAMLQAMLGAIAYSEQVGVPLSNLVLFVARVHGAAIGVVTEMRKLDLANAAPRAAAEAVQRLLSNASSLAALDRYFKNVVTKATKTTKAKNGGGHGGSDQAAVVHPAPKARPAAVPGGRAKRARP